MQRLRTIRIILALVFFLEALVFLVFSRWAGPESKIAEQTQIIPSAIAVTLGATIFWIVASFIFGRVYCSTVCPVGTLQDIAIHIRRHIPAHRKNFRYAHGRKTRRDILIIYLISLFVGFLPVPFLIEPWNMMRNMASIANREAIDPSWISLGMGAAVGIAAGIVTLLGCLVWAWIKGREFCTSICPIGTVLGAMEPVTVYHIEIDPDVCTNCMRCEEICSCSCIKVVSRHVDNSRCVRCFDCLSVCPDKAIRFQPNRNRPATPLFRRAKGTFQK